MMSFYVLPLASLLLILGTAFVVVSCAYKHELSLTRNFIRIASPIGAMIIALSLGGLCGLFTVVPAQQSMLPAVVVTPEQQMTQDARQQLKKVINGQIVLTDIKFKDDPTSALEIAKVQISVDDHWTPVEAHRGKTGWKLGCSDWGTNNNWTPLTTPNFWSEFLRHEGCPPPGDPSYRQENN